LAWFSLASWTKPESPENLEVKNPMKMRCALGWVVLLSALSAPAVAGPEDMGWQGWGVRVGLAEDADQFVGGAHFNLGELAKNLRFQPDFLLGNGDQSRSISGTAPVYYRFRRASRMTPYAGGGLALAYVDRDGDGNSDYNSGAQATGGLEWSRSAGRAFFVELSLGFGHVHDAQIIAAWSF
jgi:opacity protein-like surface antigen